MSGTTAMKTGKTVTIEQIGSPIRRPDDQEKTLIGLGLNKRHRVRTLEDTPAVRGMIAKTSGKGVNCQKARSGVAIKGFEGGQMPLHRRLPKRGFNNIFRLDYNEISVGAVQAAIDGGLVDATKPVTVAVLVAAGLLRRPLDGDDRRPGWGPLC
eukprot:gene68078-biopygen50039